MKSQDLEALWEAHCRCEFETKDVDATMATMVPEPYVNHIPTMTGGVGGDQLKRFYKYHFVGVNPPDFRLTPISRVLGSYCLVDEFIVHFTHTTEMDWLLPGVPPTGRIVEVATVAIVKFDGDKIVHEHIYWDQASVLVQIGLLDPAGLPVVGAESARKVAAQMRTSNQIMARWPESKDKPL
jgi:carboxymethylenebutenolidase